MNGCGRVALSEFNVGQVLLGRVVFVATCPDSYRL